MDTNEPAEAEELSDYERAGLDWLLKDLERLMTDRNNNPIYVGDYVRVCRDGHNRNGQTGVVCCIQPDNKGGMARVQDSQELLHWGMWLTSAEIERAE